MGVPCMGAGCPAMISIYLESLRLPETWEVTRQNGQMKQPTIRDVTGGDPGNWWFPIAIPYCRFLLKESQRSICLAES